MKRVTITVDVDGLDLTRAFVVKDVEELNDRIILRDMLESIIGVDDMEL